MLLHKRKTSGENDIILYAEGREDKFTCKMYKVLYEEVNPVKYITAVLVNRICICTSEVGVKTSQ